MPTWLAYGFGAVDFIFKPVEPKVLQSKVDCFVELAKSNQALKQYTEWLESAERHLLTSHATRILIESAPFTAFVSGQRGQILTANGHARNVLGLQLNAPVGTLNFATLTPGER